MAKYGRGAAAGGLAGVIAGIISWAMSLTVYGFYMPFLIIERGISGLIWGLIFAIFYWMVGIIFTSLTAEFSAINMADLSVSCFAYGILLGKFWEIREAYY